MIVIRQRLIVLHQYQASFNCTGNLIGLFSKWLLSVWSNNPSSLGLQVYRTILKCCWQCSCLEHKIRPEYFKQCRIYITQWQNAVISHFYCLSISDVDRVLNFLGASDGCWNIAWNSIRALRNSRQVWFKLHDPVLSINNEPSLNGVWVAV